MAWREIDTREKILSLGNNTSIVTSANTIGKTLITTPLESDITINIDVSNISCFSDATFIRFTNDVSFQNSIECIDASFISIGTSDNNILIVGSDTSFLKHFQGFDVSFDTIGSSNGAFLEFTDDVSFHSSIHGNDISFHTVSTEVISDASFHGSIKCADVSLDMIGAIDGQNIVIKNDVSFHSNIVGNDVSINVIDIANANNTPIIFRDCSFNNSIFAGDVSLNNISAVNINDKLQVTNMTIRHKFKNFLQVGDDLSGGQASAYAGSSTALSANGNVVAVGATGYNYDSSVEEGRVQVFDYSGIDGWMKKGDDLSGGQYYALAGSSTALSANGNVVAVGATGYNYDSSVDAGRVQVFDYSASSDIWIRRGGADDLSGGQAYADAGSSTALSADGNVVAVGSQGYTYGNDNNVGRVQVFNYSASSDIWIRRGGADDLSGGQASAKAGSSTSLTADGNVVAVGSPLYHYGSGNDIGRVQVFDYSASSDIWLQRGQDLSGGQANAQAGMSTSLSADGNVVAVGSQGYAYGNDNNVGRVQVFDYSASSDIWIRRGGADDLSGGQADAKAGSSTSLTADGNVIAVGSTGYDYNNSQNAGRVQVFDYSASSDIWIRRGGADDLSGGQALAYAGSSTALSANGNVVAVGATGYNYGTDTSAGRVKVYLLDISLSMSQLLSKWYDNVDIPLIGNVSY
jgi:co-chaperonin GroES (HSP10)